MLISTVLNVDRGVEDIGVTLRDGEVLGGLAYQGDAVFAETN